MLQNQRGDHDGNEEQKQADALEGPRGLLVLLCFVQLLQAFLRVLHHLCLVAKYCKEKQVPRNDILKTCVHEYAREANVAQ